MYEFIIGQGAIIVLSPDQALHLAILLEVESFLPLGYTLVVLLAGSGGLAGQIPNDNFLIFEADLLFEDRPHFLEGAGVLQERHEADELAVLIIIEETFDQQ